MEKKIMIVVDMINGFVKEGALADPSINQITDEIESLATMYLEKGHEVIAFKDCHTSDSLEFKTFPPHCLQGTEEVELVAPLKKYESQFIVFEKNGTSGFMVPDFLDCIKKTEGLTEVLITGCCTDICIMNLAIPLKNYFNQHNQPVEVVVPRNAVDTYHIPETHDRHEWNEMAFKFMKQAGIEVIESYTLKIGRANND